MKKELAVIIGAVVVIIASVFLIIQRNGTAPVTSYPPGYSPAPSVPPTPGPTPSPIPGPTPPPSGGGSSGGGANVIPTSFFALTSGPPQTPGQYPTVPVGAVGHPGLLVWPEIESSPTQCGNITNSYKWDYYDAQIGKATAHNVPMMISFGQTPACSLTDKSTCKGKICTAPPNDISSGLADLKAAVTAFANRYKGKVQYVDPCNECNGKGFWTGTVEQEVTYVNAIVTTYKAIDPNVIFLAPSEAGPVNSATAWLSSYLKAGGAALAQACNAHGYPGTINGVAAWPENDGTGNKGILTRLGDFLAVCTANGVPNTIVMTEGGWGPNSQLPNADDQAAWLARYVILQAVNEFTTHETAMAWYAWGSGGPTQYGTLANPDNTPTPAGAAFGQVYNWLAGATVDNACSANGAVWSCAISRAGGYKGLIVWNTSGSSSYAPPASFVSYRDLAGASHPIAAGASVPIGANPVILENR